VPADRPATQRSPLTAAVVVLLGSAGATFVIASAVHFGLSVRLGPVILHDPFEGAAVPEGVIAVVLACGAVTVMAGWSNRWAAALLATLFALALTAYGLTITMRSTRYGDIAYHLFILVVLSVTAVLLLLPAGSRELDR